MCWCTPFDMIMSLSDRFMYLFTPPHSQPTISTHYQIFHFCSILILLSALMFESGAQIEKKSPSCSAIPNATLTAGEKVTASHYVLVVFVIIIVVVSSLYFFLALFLELSRSCSHFLKVNRSRKKDKKTTAKKVMDMWQHAKKRTARLPAEPANTVFDHNLNPLHNPGERSTAETTLASMRRVSSDGSVNMENPLRSSSGSRLSVERKSAETKLSSTHRLSVDI